MVWNRRQVVVGGVATLLTSQMPTAAAAVSSSEHRGPGLISQSAGSAPNYFCTWAVQNYIYGDGKKKLDVTLLQGNAGAQRARMAMDAKHLLGRHGWATTFHPRARKDLYLLLDDGWEMDGTSSFILDTEKFSEFHGDPRERLHELRNALDGNGWRGAGLWCRNTPDGSKAQELLLRSFYADIDYWKIDLGDPEFELTRFKDEMKLPLTLEHVHGEPPLNGNWREDGRFEPQHWDSPRIRIFRNTDVYRTYDVTCMLSLPTTLDRVAQIMNAVQGHPEVKSLLNVEDEVYVAAVLGCTAGVLRHPLRGLRPDGDVDLFFNGPRQTKRRMDEVVRAVRWQRIAPPYPIGESAVSIDKKILTDSWIFQPQETWRPDIVGMHVKQGAPAIVARDIPLPLVHASERPPFVFATRFPNGTVAIGAQQRTIIDHAWFMPKAKVYLEIGDTSGPFGIFGHFEQLTLHSQYSLTGKRVFAQDLAGEKRFDITHAVRLHHQDLIIPGKVIDFYGLQAASLGDLSSPGLLLEVI